jgi:predicted Zn finger-like uncharacterized protein
MIVSCPSCATRHEFHNALRAPGDVKITCRSCGHRWIEIDGDAPVYHDFAPRVSTRLIDDDHIPEDDVQRLVAAARESRERYEERRQLRSRTIRGWAGFFTFMMLPVALAAMFPEAVVSAAPIANKAYERLGVGVNIYGLEIRKVEQQHAIVKGTRVLSVKGEISNVTADMKRIPWLRFALMDGSKEVYHWTLNTEARPLRPGESTSFVTRVSAPPSASQNLQIRFARADEIGATTAP